MAKKKKAVAKKPAKEKDKLLSVELKIQHSINGQSFGPGVVQVRKPVARLLREQEQRAKEGEQRFYAQDRAYLIGATNRGNVKIPVPYDHFDAAFGAGAVMYGVAGGGRFKALREE